MPKLIDELSEETNLIVDYDVREFSGVDRPAMEHAVVAAIKSKKSPTAKIADSVYTDIEPSENGDNANEEASMSEEKKKEAEKEAKAKADDAVREAVLKSLPADQKEFYESANKATQKEFIEKDFAGRQELVEKEKASREVAYKAKDGTEYLKGSDEKMIEMAKRLDALQEQSEKAAEKMAQEYVEKRVDESYASIAGSRESKIAAVKALDSIKDEELRKEAFKILDFASTAMARAMTTYGSEDAVSKSEIEVTADKSEVAAKMERMAQEKAKADNISIHKARIAVARENNEAYKSLNGLAR